MRKRGGYGLLAIASLLLLLFAAGYYAASRSGIETPQPTQAVDGSEAWVCPMHPQIRQDHAGDCPICGMHLVVAANDVHEHERHHNHASHEHPQSVAEASPAASWICPMHTHIQQDHPGSCPICGMDLVRNADVNPSEHDVGVVVDSVLQQRLGVRLAQVERRALNREVRTWGTVTVDGSSQSEISTKVDGWLRKLHVSAVGETVRVGQPLYELYSPELVQRQREYIELLRRGEQLREAVGMGAGQNATMLASLARERIRNQQLFLNADVDKELIRRIEKYRRTVDVVVVRAARAGVVTAIGAREGSYVTPQVNLLSLADLSKVWIDIALYPDQLAWVSAGDVVTATTQEGLRDEISGRLQLPNPLIDRASRTLRGRLALTNAGKRLLPGAYVDVRITTPSRQALALPRSALIRGGKGDKVMLANDDGRFLPTPVQTGIGDDDYIEIVSGLDEGDQVAVKGQFLLDAAASMDAASRRMRDAR